MKNTLNIAVLQTNIVWENSTENLRALDLKLEAISSIPDVIILPEMFNTGFTMNTQTVAQTMDGEAVHWLRRKSSQLGTAICGSVIINESNKYYNRFLWAEQGQIKVHYDKRHLFRMAREEQFFAPGSGRPTINYHGWKIMPRVCYDLRFPVWNRSKEIDIQLYVASWPEPRILAWTTLLKARAIENQCYVIGVNRVGQDGNQVNFNGRSLVVNPKGEAMTLENNEEEGFIYADLNFDELAEFRKKFPVHKDADDFDIHINQTAW